MPKNENENLDHVETPAEYTPPVTDEATEAQNVNDIEDASAKKRRLGTGAIIGISAAGVALLGGVFASGYAVASVTDDDHRPPMSGQFSHDSAMMDDDDRHGDFDDMDSDDHGPRPPHGPKGQFSGDVDGPMPGNMPHEHDENGQDIVPQNSGTSSTTPAPTN